MVFPDYDRSILSTTASVLRHFGVESVYPSLPELDRRLAQNPRHVALILTDGAGVIPMEKSLPADSWMRSHVRAAVTSICPSTTTAACTSYFNGMSALEHGWLGWFLYFKEYASDAATFFRSTYYTNKAIDGPQPAVALMPFETVFDRIRRASPEVVCRTQYAFDTYCAHGAHQNLRIGSFRELCDNQRRISAGKERTFTLSYWGQPDTAMHKSGVGSPDAVEQFTAIDRELRRLSGQLTDTLLIVTADHGLINSSPIDITRMSDLTECLVMPPMIESRCAAFYVKSHRKEQFERVFRERLGDWFLLIPRDEVYRKGLFGRGQAHPKFDDFIGDYVACATSDRHIEYPIPGVHADRLVGLHAGLTEDEMLVPVITND